MLTVRPHLDCMDWLKELLVLYCLMEERLGAVLLWSLCLLLSVRDRCPHVGLQARETLIVLLMGCAV